MSSSTRGISKQTICQWLGYTRQAHHQRLQHAETTALNAEIIVQLTSDIRRRAGPRLGTLKVYREAREVLNELNIKCGRDKFFDILRAYDLLIEPKKRHVRTTDSSAWMRQFDDLRVDFTPTGPDQLWVADITYIRCQERKLYLSLITDAYSRQIMGWRLHGDLTTEGCVLALNKALERRAHLRNRIIHHSDRGCQYCSRGYVRRLRTQGFRISTTQNGSPYENPLAESVNGQLKVEYSLDQRFITEVEAREAVEQAIEMYNKFRPHGALDYRKPSQVHYGQLHPA